MAKFSPLKSNFFYWVLYTFYSMLFFTEQLTFAYKLKRKVHTYFDYLILGVMTRIVTPFMFIIAASLQKYFRLTVTVMNMMGSQYLGQ